MGYEAMNRAKANKDDEFYTYYADVAKEIPHYSRYLHGKSIICMCDDPRWSKIYAYMKDNYHKLGLKRLISSHLENPRSFVTVYDGSRTQAYDLDGNGDFRSHEVRTWVERADVGRTCGRGRDQSPVLAGEGISTYAVRDG